MIHAAARHLVPALGIFLLTGPTAAQDQVTGHLLAFGDNGAWCWFEDNRAIVDPLRGRLLVGSVGDSSGLGGSARSGDIDVSWLDLTEGRFGSFELHNQLEGDDHDSPAFLLRPDGRYLTLYCRHGGDNITRYLISSQPGDPTAWSPLSTYAHSAGVTYSNVYRLSDTGRTYNFCRAVNFDPNVIWSDDDGATWSGAGKLLTEGGGSDRPYARYASDDRRRVHVLTTNRHPRNYDNSIYHGYVENDRLHKSDGTVVDSNILDGSGRPPSQLTAVFQTGTMVGGVAMRRGWTIDLEADDGDEVRALFQMRANNQSADHRLFFGHFDGSSWTTHEVCRLGGYLYSAEDDYTGLAALHPDRPDTIYVSTVVDPRNGGTTSHYEIYEGTTANQGANWAWTAITENSSVDNLRPIVPAWDAQRTALLWLRGDYYTYTSFDLAVVGRIEAPELAFDPATYHDATTANTTLANGSPANPTGPSSTQGANDNLWHLRSGYGNGGFVWTASEGGAENAPTLRTRLSGVAPGTHDVFLVFWSNPNEDWTLQAGFAPNALRTVQKRGAAILDNAHFTSPLLNSTASVRAYSLWVGRTAPDASGNLDVYLNDLDTGQSGSSRTWYDGIAIAPVANAAATQEAGHGCGGNASLDATGTPQLGGSVQLSISGATPGSWAMSVFGIGWLTPLSLASSGLTGCTLFVDPWGTFSFGVVDSAGQSPAASISFPNVPSLRDLRLGLQAGALGAGVELTPALVLLPGS